MNLVDYKAQALAFCSRLDGYLPNLTHAGLGLATEGIEFIDGVLDAMVKAGTAVEDAAAADANFIEELGDLCWFAVLLADVKEIGLDLFTIDPWQSAVVDAEIFIAMVKLAAIAGDLGDLTKKELVYAAPIERSRYVQGLERFFRQLRIVCRSVEMGLTVEKVLAANIAKLSARFPDRAYAQSAALNRDKGAEMAAITESVAA